MPWDDLFEDLENQLASEWEAERQALDAESHRLRIARLDLRARLRALRGQRVRLDFVSGEGVEGRMRACGADWLAVELGEHIGIVPLDALVSIRADHGALLQSLGEQDAASAVQERMTLGFVLRDLARRRVPVTITPLVGPPCHGTIDRAGADHLDLAVHEAGEPRRARSVRDFRLLPFRAITLIRLAGERYQD